MQTVADSRLPMCSARLDCLRLNKLLAAILRPGVETPFLRAMVDGLVGICLNVRNKLVWMLNRAILVATSDERLPKQVGAETHALGHNTDAPRSRLLGFSECQG